MVVVSSGLTVHEYQNYDNSTDDAMANPRRKKLISKVFFSHPIYERKKIIHFFDLSGQKLAAVERGEGGGESFQIKVINSTFG
jgi:hypothetical protein